MVKIKCYKHGIFLQEPRNHLQGFGCRDRDKIKCIVAEVYQFNMLVIPYTEINNIDNILFNYIKRMYKYRIGNKFFRNIISISKELNLNGGVTPRDVEKYLFKIAPYDSNVI